MSDNANVIHFPAGTPIFTSDDELGGVPEADANGDQTGGQGPL